MLQPTVVALCLIGLPGACAGRSTQGAEEPAVATPADPASVAPAQPAARGEVVEELSDGLWVVFQDSRSAHWFGSNGQGAYRVEGGTITRFSTRDGLVNDQIRQILEDGAGHLYFGTSGGISRFDGQGFSTLVPVEGLGEWRLDPGDLWFTGWAGGPFRYDGQTLQQVEFPRHSLEDLFRSRFPGAPSSPYSIYTMLRDSRGSMWFGTANFGVCRYDGTSFLWISEDELTELDFGPALGVRGLIEDRDGRFWLGNLLHRYDAYPEGGDGTAAPAYTRERGLAEPEDLGPCPAYFMSGLTDRQGVSWVATYGNGVWRLDARELTHFPVLAEGRQIHLLSIHEDRAGVLWLGTQEDGAWRFDGKVFERFRP